MLSSTYLEGMLAGMSDSPDPWAAWLERRIRQGLNLPGYRRAAVLAALSYECPPRLLLTVRAGTLPTHRGEVAFAGGSLEAGETPAQAAQREAWEEVGLSPERVTVLGELDDVFTPLGSGSGFHVTPVLARFWPPERYQLSGEVTRILRPTLAELRASAKSPSLYQAPDGSAYPMYEYSAERVRVWGMTARVIHGS